MKNKTLFLLFTLALLTLFVSACAAPVAQTAEVPSVQTVATGQAVDLSQSQPAAPLDQNALPVQAYPNNSQPTGNQPQSINTQPASNQPMQSGQGDQPGQNNDCRSDLAAAAAALGITAEELQAALGEPAQGRPDLAAAAAKLGVTEEALKQAMQQSLPAACANTGGGQGNGKQPPQEAFTACVGLTQGAACTVNTPNGTLAGACNLPMNSSTTTELACMPAGGPPSQ